MGRGPASGMASRLLGAATLAPGTAGNRSLAGDKVCIGAAAPGPPGGQRVKHLPEQCLRSEET